MRIALLAPLLLSCLAAGPQITLHRVGNNGLEPQAAVDSGGRIHLIYFEGDPKAGDVFYCTSEDGGKTFSPPRRVNNVANSALIIGAVRGPKLAIGKDDRPQVIWTGSESAQPKPRLAGAPLLYARLNDAGDVFEPQKQLIAAGPGIDGGASISADKSGNVFVAWHAPAKSDGDEESRRIWVLRSSDQGKTFADPATPINQPKLGACACCAVQTFLDASDDNRLCVVYRTAHQLVHRDMFLLSFDPDLKHAAARRLSEWKMGKCVMSTAAAADGFIAWESQERILIAGGSATDSMAFTGKNPKHPALAASADHVLLVWTEETGWNKGGKLTWRLLNRALGAFKSDSDAPTDLPVWDYPAAVANADGSFVIFY